MCHYFVNCDDLRHATTIHGLAGKWKGSDNFQQFHSDDGTILVWVVNASWAFTGDVSPETIIAALPELIPWEDAVIEVADRMEAMRSLERENAALRKRLCII